LHLYAYLFAGEKMTKEALKLALEALKGVLDDAPKVLDASIAGGLYEVVQCRDAITAIKEALAQPEQGQFALKHRIAELEGAVIGLQAQRTWVGLTEDEAIELLPAGDWEIESTLEFAKAVETKLKENNFD
jgi:hypothetical protein